MCLFNVKFNWKKRTSEIKLKQNVNFSDLKANILEKASV